MFKCRLGLALGKCLWELDNMPAEEWRVWCKYHATEGLPDLSLLFGNTTWILAQLLGGSLSLDDCLLRPRPEGPERSDGFEMSPEDMADHFKRMFAGRLVDRSNDT